MSKKIVIGAIVGCVGLIVIIGLAYGLAYGLNDSKKVAQPTAEQLKSFNVVCCKKLLLTSTKGKIHHSLTGIYARMEQNFVKYSPMPVPLYFKTDFRNELNGFQATIYFDHKSKPKCPEGCWVIGMCRGMTDDCKNVLYSSNKELLCPIHRLNLKTTFSSLELSHVVENQEEYYLKCIDWNVYFDVCRTWHFLYHIVVVYYIYFTKP